MRVNHTSVVTPSGAPGGFNTGAMEPARTPPETNQHLSGISRVCSSPVQGVFPRTDGRDREPGSRRFLSHLLHDTDHLQVHSVGFLAWLPGHQGDCTSLYFPVPGLCPRQGTCQMDPSATWMELE